MHLKLLYLTAAYQLSDNALLLFKKETECQSAHGGVAVHLGADKMRAQSGERTKKAVGDKHASSETPKMYYIFICAACLFILT